ncbi:MAG: hypothetical protein Q9176_003398 [Flavoplaca citrina]
MQCGRKDPPAVHQYPKRDPTAKLHSLPALSGWAASVSLQHKIPVATNAPYTNGKRIEESGTVFLRGGCRRSTFPTFANGSVRAEAQERSKLRKLQNTIQLDHSITNSQPLDAAQAATPAVNDIHGLQRLKVLMLEDRASFLPKEEELKQLHGETISNIFAVVDKIMKITLRAGGRHPQFLLTVHCPQSFPLVEHIFGAGKASAEELLKTIVTV